jgi:phosphate:Na+ symporter
MASIWEIILMVLGGLGLFLFAINNLSDTLKELLGDKAKKWLGFFTKTFSQQY